MSLIKVSSDQKAHETRVIQACMTAIRTARSAGWDPAYFKLREEDARLGQGCFDNIGGVAVDIWSRKSHLVGLRGFDSQELFGVCRFSIWPVAPSALWVPGPTLVISYPDLPKRAVELLSSMRTDKFYLPADERDLEMCFLLDARGLAARSWRSGVYVFEITKVGMSLRSSLASSEKMKEVSN